MNIFNHQVGKYHQIDGADIYYEITGQSGAPIILLLHGGFGSMEDFNSVIPILTEKYNVIGVDSRGHGKSTTGGKKLTYERLQKDVESLLLKLDIKNPIIIGLSDGGITAYRLAASGVFKIEKLVTVGSRWHINDALITEDLFLKISAESWKKKFPGTFTLYQKLNPEPDFDRLFSSLIAMWLDMGNSGYLNEQLKNLTCDLLIVRGDQDHLLSRKSAANLAGLVENSMLLNIPFAGHVTFADQPEIFSISLGEFLKYSRAGS